VWHSKTREEYADELIVQGKEYLLECFQGMPDPVFERLAPILERLSQEGVCIIGLGPNETIQDFASNLDHRCAGYYDPEKLLVVVGYSAEVDRDLVMLERKELPLLERFTHLIGDVANTIQTWFGIEGSSTRDHSLRVLTHELCLLHM
jgi:hypothetical protein